jgi:prepilin-type N-terminal cleavage/methylation domain-containing protein
MKNRVGFKRRSDGGFSLIELLVVIAIIGLLTSLVVPTLGRAKQRAAMINEMNSARQVILAWQMYADDHHGAVLPGYRYGFAAFNRLGEALTHPINARYPWRLAPYLGNHFEVLYVNRNRGLLHNFARGNEENYAYAASVFPSLGVNAVFVGGDDLLLPPTSKATEIYGPFCVLKTADVHRPSKLLTFISAQGPFHGATVEGFYRVEPPYLGKRVWQQAFDPALPPEHLGFVHPRFGGRAVAAIVDGHSAALTFQELEEMQRWSNLADQPDWRLESR